MEPNAKCGLDTGTVVSTDANPRVGLVSMREFNRQAAWCSNYEFEDVVCAVDDVDLIRLQPGRGFATRQWLARRLIWRRGWRRLPLNPGLQPIVLRKDYDLLVFICMNPSDLIYLNALTGWEDRCKVSACYVAEFYVGWIKEYAFQLSLLAQFDHVFMAFGGSVEAVQNVVGRPCHHLPLGVDALRFSPYPEPPPRSIDVYSMGRRLQPIHEALLRMADRNELFYIHDTIPGVMIQPSDYREHRNLVANIAKRSRYFIAFPAKVDCRDETHGQSEVGARFYEGTAAGAILIGQAPTAPAFRKDFDWPDAIIETGSDETSLSSALGSLRGEPDRALALGRRNAVEALRRFDWAYRWKDLLRVAGVAPSPRLASREKRLRELAEEAAGSGAQRSGPKSLDNPPYPVYNQAMTDRF